MISITEINDYFGDMDLLLMDQLLKGNVEKGPLLDVGFGEGRHLVHFLNRQFPVTGVDIDAKNVALLKSIFPQGEMGVGPRLLLADAMDLPWEDETFQTVLCTRVFHSLNTTDQFRTAWHGLCRVLKVGGLLYFTTNTAIGFEDVIVPKDGGKFCYPNGQEELLLTNQLLQELLDDPALEKVEYVRFQRFENIRCEATIVLRKVQ